LQQALAKQKADRHFARFEKDRRKLEDSQAAEELAKEIAELESKSKQFEPPSADE